MNCSTCGQRMPEGAMACPQCGTFVADSNTRTSISSSSNPTIASSAYNQGRQAEASQYGVDPYSAPGIPPTREAAPSSPVYSAYNPPHAALHYNVTEQIPPPPPGVALAPARPAKKRGGLIIGMVALLVVLFGGGGFLLLANRGTEGLTQAQLNATATAKTAQGAMASATAVQGAAAKNPYGASVNTLVLTDTLRDNSKGYKWDEATMYGNNNQGGTAVCGFQGGAYHLTRQQIGALLCSPEAAQLTLSNLAFEANLNLIQGDYPGIVFRINQAQGTGYLLDIDTQGRYAIFLMNLNAKANQEQYKTLRGGANAAIKKGQHQSNLLAIVAKGSTISMYINNQFIDSVQDKTYSSGQIGMYVYGSKASDLMVNSARVWKL